MRYTKLLDRLLLAAGTLKQGNADEASAVMAEAVAASDFERDLEKLYELQTALHEQEDAKGEVMSFASEDDDEEDMMADSMVHDLEDEEDMPLDEMPTKGKGKKGKKIKVMASEVSTKRTREEIIAANLALLDADAA